MGMWADNFSCDSCCGIISETDSCKKFADTVYLMMITYAVPLFLLTLYYNYGYDYGFTGLHLVYPLIALLPFVLTGHRSREMLDMCQAMTFLSIMFLVIRHSNYFALAGIAVQTSVYFCNKVRGCRYRRFSSRFVYDVTMILCSYLLYVACLQACVDLHGSIDCARTSRKFHEAAFRYCKNRPAKGDFAWNIYSAS